MAAQVSHFLIPFTHDPDAGNVMEHAQELQFRRVYSLCQWFLQCLWWGVLRHTASPVFWAELGKKIPQYPYHLLGHGVQTDSEEESDTKRN